VLSLVIADDLDPSLECPLCGRLFVLCSIEVSFGSCQCSSCRGSFALADLKLAAPSDLSVKDEGRNWTIDIATRSPRAGLVALVACLALLLGLAHLGTVFPPANPDDPFSSLNSVVILGLLALTLASLAAAAYWLWGRNSISMRDSEVTAFRGLGHLASGRPFLLPWLTAFVSPEH
jgi:hypothetical protein